MALADGEGGLLFVHEGRVRVDGREAERRTTILAPPDSGARLLAVTAEQPTRLFRAVYGPGFGLVRSGER